MALSGGLILALPHLLGVEADACVEVTHSQLGRNSRDKHHCPAARAVSSNTLPSPALRIVGAAPAPAASESNMGANARSASSWVNLQCPKRSTGRFKCRVNSEPEASVLRA